MGSKSDHVNWVRTFDVSDPRRHKKGFTVYKVTSRLFPKADPGGVTTLVVWKRYNDFKKLYVELEQIHRQLYLPRKFPEFPKGRVFGRFEYEVIEERKGAALSLLHFVATHVPLFTSKIFIKFFEDGYDTSDLSNISNINAPSDQTYHESNGFSPELAPCLVPQRLHSVSTMTATMGLSKPYDTDMSSSITSTSLDSDTDSDSILSGSIISSIRKPSPTGPLSGGAIRKSRSEFTMPTFHLDSSLADGENAPTVEESQSESSTNKAEPNSVPFFGSANQDDHVLSSLNAVRVEVEESPSSSSATDASIGLGISQRVIEFFDFLPKFPKRDKEVKGFEEKLLSQALSSSYICEAAGHFAIAQDHESNGNFSEAFTSYKEGIRILLIGAKNDKDPKRQLLVKKKLGKYLTHAETLHGQLRCSAQLSPTVFPLPKIQSPVRVLPESHSQYGSSNPYACIIPPFPHEELKYYRIVDIIDSKVYVVMNISDKTGIRCNAMKVLPFSTDPIEPLKKTVMPDNVPFMVKLIKWFETDSSYILLLQYAGGGKLLDYINSYQRKSIARVQVEVNSEETGQNAFSQNFLKTDEFPVSSTEEGATEQENSGSYSQLLHDYSQAPFEESAKLAKIPLAPHVENNMNTDFRIYDEKNDDLVQVEENIAYSYKDGPTQNTSSKILRECSSKSNADDIIECSKELIGIINHALQNEIPKDKNFEPWQRHSHFGYAGEYVSRSLEDISLLSSIPDVLWQGRIESKKDELSKQISTTDYSSQEADTSTSEAFPVEAEEALKRTVPESCLKGWATEMIMCLEKFHSSGLIYGDLSMKNILLGENGHILLSFKAQWSNVDQMVTPITNEYSAPEIVHSSGESFWKIHPSCDYWSLGAVLFQLFTGQTVHGFHPEGFHQQTVVRIPSRNIIGETISSEVRSLLTELLEINPELRLGFYGAEEIKSHPCFDGFDWEYNWEAGI